jgi:hypothetical protein
MRRLDLLRGPATTFQLGLVGVKFGLVGVKCERCHLPTSPLHPKDTGTLFIYREADQEAAWHCFGCGARGTATPLID